MDKPTSLIVSSSVNSPTFRRLSSCCPLSHSLVAHPASTPPDRNSRLPRPGSPGRFSSRRTPSEVPTVAPTRVPAFPNPPESSGLLPPIASSLLSSSKQALVKFFYGDGQQAFLWGSAEATTIPAG